MAKTLLPDQLALSMADLFPAGVLVLAPTGEITLWNRQQQQLTGLAAAEVLSRPWTEVAAQLFPDAGVELEELVLSDATAGFFALQIAGRQLQLRRSDGVEEAVNVLFFPVAGQDGWLIGVFSRPAAETVEVDPDLPLPSASQLEGVPNRYELSFMMPQQLAILSRYNIPFTLLFLELKNYQPLVDRLGLQGWKATLRAIYESLLSIVRRADFVGGYDHVTFWLLLTNADKDGSRAVAEKMRQHAGKITVENLAVTLSAVVGGAVAQPNESPEKFFTRAQEALRRADGEPGGIFIAT